MKTSKIARLPHELREQLNHRLLDHEPAETLLPWLNAQPETKEILARHFNAQPVTPQNLSQWRQGGFAHWQLYHDLVDSLAELALTSGELQKTDPAQLAEAMTTVLMAHYARFLSRWNGDATPEDCRRIRLLGAVGRSLHQFRQPALRTTAQAGATPSVPSIPPSGATPIQGNPVKPSTPSTPSMPSSSASIQSNPVKPPTSAPPVPVLPAPPAPAKARSIQSNPACDPEPPSELAVLQSILSQLPPEAQQDLLEVAATVALHRGS